MAGQITGKFVADFASFNDAVNKAVVNLKGMETGASKVQTSLDRMVDAFSGRKIIQEAELMGKTFELLAEKGIGLTTKELQRMGIVAEEAMAKLRAGGEPIPAAMQKIADAANKVKPALDGAQSSASTLFSTLSKAAGAFGIAFSVGAITRFVGSVLDTASAIGDLSQQLGISAEAVQRFKFAAEQSGSSLDAVGTSLQFLNKTLGAGGAGTKQALKDLGLEFDQIRNMRPEDYYVTIGDALGGMTDKAKQAEIGTQLMGRGFAELLPAMEDGILKVGNQTAVMSDSTIRDLKRAQDAWSALGTWVTTVSGTIIANTISTVQSVTRSWQDFAMFVANVVETKSIGAALALSDIAAKARELKPALDAATDKSHALGQAELAEKTREATKALDAQKEAARKLKDEWDTYITAALKRGDAQLKYIGQLETGLKNVDTTMGKFVTGHLKELGDRGEKIFKDTADAAVRLGLDMAGLHPVILGLNKDFMDFTATGIKALDTLKETVAKLPKTFEQTMGEIQGSVNKWLNVSLEAVERAFGPRAAAAMGQLQQLSDDTFQAVSGLARVMAGDFSGFVDLIVGGINSIKTQWKLMIGLFNQREGRHAIEDFAESFGGFDALHAQLLTLGAEGEAMWIKLTQGTPAGNADAAAKAIAEVEEALGKQAEAADDVTAATEDQAQATIETASQAAKALEELGPRIDANKNEWQGWGDLVTAQIQRIADGIRAMPLPSATAIAGGGNGGIHGGMGPIMNGDVVVRSNLYLDGYVAAESVSRQVVG